MPPQRAQRREMRRPLPRWGSDDGSDREASAEHDACRSKFGDLGCRGLGGCIYPAGLTLIRQRAANEVEVEYTTSHVLISETARESVPITIFFDPQVTGSSGPSVLLPQWPRLGHGRPQWQRRPRRDQSTVLTSHDAGRERIRKLSLNVQLLPSFPLRCRQISVSIGISTHSHVPMAHGGYATT